MLPSRPTSVSKNYSGPRAQRWTTSTYGSASLKNHAPSPSNRFLVQRHQRRPLRFTSDEDDSLKKGIDKHGFGQWTAILRDEIGQSVLRVHLMLEWFLKALVLSNLSFLTKIDLAVAKRLGLYIDLPVVFGCKKRKDVGTTQKNTEHFRAFIHGHFTHIGSCGSCYINWLRFKIGSF